MKYHHHPIHSHLIISHLSLPLVKKFIEQPKGNSCTEYDLPSNTDTHEMNRKIKKRAKSDAKTEPQYYLVKYKLSIKFFCLLSKTLVKYLLLIPYTNYTE